MGATVMLRGSTKGTSTDANGSYTLEVPNGENTFVVGYGGYQDETATSHDGQPLNVTLLPSPNSKVKSRRR
ncbi:carboxypeptidase-like regulatory domain-containing protein [Hymenobacter sp. BRD128]|uniref:carboxypeptidase-like regulatory domain-containing protein n=1 Tax=Hymenobacter sp. BRD128 TaxID=2675878 RepID=UPI00156717CE|nr:carboxypeptidase-like regulatory domain-containing protein [Hymenobacter sp. BRD128]QKG56612.1 carboxypeptidase-like regulatory domain-containing protein [Hymenobacter sp. BRD128]